MQRLHSHMPFALSCAAVIISLLAAPTSACADQRGSAQAQAQFKELKARFSRADVTWRAGQPGAHLVTGLALKAKGRSFQARARTFVNEHSALIGVHSENLRHIETSRSSYRIVVRFQQIFANHEVVDRLLAVRMKHDGTILGFVSDLLTVNAVPKAKISSERARQIAAAWTSMRHIDAAKLDADAKILALPSGSRPVWQIHVMAVPMRAHLRVLVDAANGSVLSVRNLVRH